ncbi:hypothetical protein [uncultured Microscilla sp.]|uniref:hypothetical protein n=1 Tax=uncultured Microscilla sp. TaxID=432653 RepID=UPI00261D3263|nr:hypothetical protein [uncultured Microscilla sp.]
MSEQEIQNLIKLLKSDETQYWEIAFQIMKGAGVPNHPEVYRYATNNNHKVLLSYQHNLLHQLSQQYPSRKPRRNKKKW